MTQPGYPAVMESKANKEPDGETGASGDDGPVADEAAPERAAQDLESELEEMERKAERLGDEVDETRADWRRKQSDETIPGAEPPESEPSESEPSESEPPES